MTFRIKFSGQYLDAMLVLIGSLKVLVSILLFIVGLDTAAKVCASLGILQIAIVSHCFSIEVKHD